MFGSSETKKPAPAAVGPGSVIAKGMTLSGEFSGDGDILLEGRFTGTIRCRSLTIGENGHLEGRILGETVIVKGRIEGEIHAKKAILHSSAHVTGDVHHEILEIAAGAQVEGRYCRQTPEKAAIKPKMMDRQKEAPPRSKASPTQTHAQTHTQTNAQTNGQSHSRRENPRENQESLPAAE